ncbi:SusC/RagA family TonB-linked outer membrane protein [Pontibacter beigongshangensis]|uniref:SusC/RagA family TonB-linked outer membrane protein n=1 Tax=Pontibacter beigongshangensis TaxID=2574733 RepID=UPI00164F5C26|nr:TonB-dependent receptor [Pontibacter beigongshangensis]
MNHFLPKPQWLLGLSFMLVWNAGYSQELADATISPGVKKSQKETLVLKSKASERTVPLSQVQQAITVSGQVKDQDSGDPLPGVSVLIKNTTKGAITDIDGNFSLAVPNAEAVLVFSYIGYKAQEVVVGTRNTINISLGLEASTLEQVVVVGYGEQKRANLTGAVETLDAKEIQDIPVPNLAQALIGRMAGVRVSMPTGKPGQSNPLVIRRQTDKSAIVDEILYVIDGVQFYDGGAQFNMLDASEVESVSVLKDGAAAVYGARAGGGVVLVKTKRGTKGKPKISYNTSIGIGTPTQFPDMLSAKDHALMVNEMLDQKHRKYYVSPAQYERNKRIDRFNYFSDDELAAMDTLNYDWLDGLYKDATTVRHTLNVSGGGDNVRYFVGGSYYNETGNIKSLNYKKYSLRTNVEADITKDVTFSIGLNTNRNDGKEPTYSGDSGGLLREFYKRLVTAPKWTPPTVDGRPVFIDGSWNPYGLIDSESYKSSASSTSTVTGALDYRLPFIEGLKAKAQFSYNQNSGRGITFNQSFYTYAFRRAGANSHLYTNELSPTNSLQTNGNKAGLQQSSGESSNYQFNASLTYNRIFGDHQVDALLVYEQQESQNRDFRMSQEGVQIEGVDQWWAFNRSAIPAGGASESGRLAYIGRVNYNYKGKYLLESAFRYEASQKYHPDYAWGLFPNVSAGWIISEEPFFRDNIGFIDFFKFRASYGRIGQETNRPFTWRQSFSASGTGPLFGTGTTANSATPIDVRNDGIAIPTATWGKSDYYNVGIDSRMFNNKVRIGLDAFYRYNWDGLIARGNSPTTLGVDKPPLENAGEGYSKGVEFSLGYENNIGKDFNYSIGGNISYNYGRPTFLFQNPAVLGRWDDLYLNDPSHQPGLIALGIIRTQEDLDRVLAMYPTIDGVPVEQGMIYYQDIHGENYSQGPDGVIDQWDRTVIAKRTNPAYVYGFTLGASYKRFRLSGTFNGGFGHKVFIEKDEMALPSPTTNVFSFWRDYWTPDNPDASMPRPYNYGYADQISTFWMRNGHTLRLVNVNLSYDLPASISEKWKLPHFRIYYTGTNLLTLINPFDHKDPSVSRAYDYPMVTTSSLGLNVTF